MKPWGEKKFGECSYLVEGAKACCAPVVDEDCSSMRGRYCEGHYELMIDRPAMERVARKNGRTPRVQAENVARWFTRHERIDEYQAIKPKAAPVVTVWDSGRGG